MELEFATTDQLIDELMKRRTCASIVVRCDREVTNAPLGGETPITIKVSPPISQLQSAQLLCTALNRILVSATP